MLDDGAAGLAAIAASLRDDEDFAERPLWRHLPAETGPWTRQAAPEPVPGSMSAWQRLGARLADLAALACGALPAIGAVPLRRGEGLAYSEMSRGLLMHWVQLDDADAPADRARVARFRVLAPTEWNFHPDGALARLLGSGRLDDDDTRLAALSLDPCIRFDLVGAPHA